MLSPAQLVKAARQQDRILSPLHHPLGTWEGPGEHSYHPKEAGE